MTKLIPFAAAALALTAGAALADNTFTVDRARSDAATLTLTNVQAEQAGELQAWQIGEDGRAVAFLGRAPVEAGVAGDVVVPLNQTNRDGKVQVILFNSNRNVAQVTLDEPLTN